MGTMIVAMLLGPIAGIALALVDSDIKFLWKSTFSLLAGAAVVMVAAFVIGIYESLDLETGNGETVKTYRFT
ncbi:DUF389 domain-containing protein [Methylomicrobium sp. RS1]|uniref:DUF389 domain-containing protein n=1 Tax=Candidatus Methylomicrobium oryzae TaxID=2802053 RepID=UPI00192066D4|nr:DUF389 domain-containing protein [Methylomicrobium sp. RS1]MBL1265278.1 DUF389 domain-containing protein [Methylomicrobium sp. RS1]